MELQSEFEGLSNEMMERIEQLQEEVQGLQEFRQHKVRAVYFALCFQVRCFYQQQHCAIGRKQQLPN